MSRSVSAAVRLLPLLMATLVAVTGCAEGREPQGEAEPPAGSAEATPAAEPGGSDQQDLIPIPAADVDGDGQGEWITGLSDTWTTEPVLIHRMGQEPYTLATNGWEHKVSVHILPNLDRAVLLEWLRFEDGRTAVGIRAFTSERGELEPIWLPGWGLKHADTTPATRASFTADGNLLVEWDMGDPARHTRVREYQVNLKQGNVNIVQERFVPEGGELVYPDEPEDVLRAAHVAAILGLSDELPRYFASPDVAEAFQAAVRPGPYEMTWVELVHVTEYKEYCVPVTEPAEVGEDGSAPFLISIGGIWDDTMEGRVWFDIDESGRTVIRDFQVTLEYCPVRP